jgi:hypothetical protein
VLPLVVFPALIFMFILVSVEGCSSPKNSVAVVSLAKSNMSHVIGVHERKAAFARSRPRIEDKVTLFLL